MTSNEWAMGDGEGQATKEQQGAASLFVYRLVTDDLTRARF